MVVAVSTAERRVRETFVVYATASVLRRASELGFAGCLENAVRDAILAGRMRFHPFAGMAPFAEGERLVEVDGLLAHTLRQDETPDGRRRLLVTRIERAPRNRNRNHNPKHEGRRRR